jgi:hypothetical protein
VEDHVAVGLGVIESVAVRDTVPVVVQVAVWMGIAVVVEVNKSVGV